MRSSFRIIMSIIIPVLLLGMLFITGCSEDEGEDVMMDGSYWNIINPEELKIPGAVYPLSSGEAIVGAEYEHVYYTNDGGVNWQVRTIDPTNSRGATDIFFSSTCGIMIGTRGMLYTTTDDGITWSDAATPKVSEDTPDLYDIMPTMSGDPNRIWIAGDKGSMLKSVDGGLNWNRDSVGICTNYDSFLVVDTLGDSTWIEDTTICLLQDKIIFWGGYAYNNDLIYALGDTALTDDEIYLFRTQDGGDTWNMLSIALSVPFQDCYFSEETSGLIFGSAGAVYSIEVAESSASISFVTSREAGQDLKEVEFIDENNAWVVGANSIVMRSTNSGTNWSDVDVDITGDIKDIGFLDSDEGWIVGHDESRGTGAIKLTTDGGDTWNFRSYGLGLALFGVHFVDANEGWLVGKSGRIAHTIDGGNIWLHQDANTSKTFRDVYFANSNDGWVVGFSSEGATDTFTTILYTTNGGGQWNSVDSIYGYRLNEVEFFDDQYGWVVGDKGLIMRSEDGGMTWTTQTSGLSVELFDLEVIGQNEAFASGQYGTILHTDDGGVTWNQLNTETTQTLMGIDFVGSTGYACGNLGTILKTENSGSTWEKLDLPKFSGTVFNSIGFINESNGWAVGKFGYILHTIDGGETWYRQNEGFSESTLNDIFILNSNTAWIIGDESTFLELVPGS